MINSVSIIIPVYNDNLALDKLLGVIQNLDAEVIVSDIEPNKLKIKYPHIRFIVSEKGRGVQQNTASKLAKNDILWFIHADSIIDNSHLRAVALSKYKWGRFNIKLSSNRVIFRIIEFFINQRSAITSINTGDQAIFVNRIVFNKIGGFKNIELMEDIQLSKDLKAYKADVVKLSLITSARKWEQGGILKTILLMWKLRFYFFIGFSASKLNKMYYK